MRKTIILFDLDGTLIDSTEAILEGFNVAFKKFNQKAPADEVIKSHIGKTLHDMFNLMGVEERLLDSYVLAYKTHYRTIHTQKTHLLPKAKEALELASSFATLGVVTTKTGKYSIEILKHLGVMDYFEVLIGMEDVSNPKPHPEPILKALSRLNQKDIDKSNSWMIGDTPMDILSAKNAKINPIGVTSGYGSFEELSRDTSLIFPDAFEAIKYLSPKR